MSETKQTKEQLLKRRDEINDQLTRVNRSERLTLDNDLEEQSIETEQEEVSIAREANLRKELNQIEDHLLDLEE